MDLSPVPSVSVFKSSLSFCLSVLLLFRIAHTRLSLPPWRYVLTPVIYLHLVILTIMVVSISFTSQGILDFSRDFDVSLMDRVVMAFYSGAGQEVRVASICMHSLRFNMRSTRQQQLAQQVLTQFQDSPDAWTRVPDILERSSFPQTKVRSHH